MDLIFLTWEQEGFGIFITRKRMDMLIKFKYLKNNIKNWGDFWTLCDPFMKEYLGMFMRCDEVKPKSKDSLIFLHDDLFILNDNDFPIIQLAEETTKDIHNKFYETCDYSIEYTEYGEAIDVIPLTELESMKDLGHEKGIYFDVVESPFKLVFND